uniref:Uncharacterized protein n=1 Tax=Myotis myotis TaxID=51298 RepID=A0A7J7UCM0_MYOMY|nr:hypothetical protein mMyoMyo1_008736 [Myotis myotis]
MDGEAKAPALHGLAASEAGGAPRAGHADPCAGAVPPPSHSPGVDLNSPWLAFPRAEARSTGPECLFRPGWGSGQARRKRPQDVCPRGGQAPRPGGRRTGRRSRRPESAASVAWILAPRPLLPHPQGQAAHNRHLVDKESGWKQGETGTLSPAPASLIFSSFSSHIPSSLLWETCCSASQT